MAPSIDIESLRRAASTGDIQACYRLGVIELQHNRAPDRAAHLLEQAAGKGHGDARNVLGTMRLNGLGLSVDTPAARADFAGAAEAGSVAAPYNLANLLYNGIGGGVDRTAAAENLLEAARRGHPPALRVLALTLGDDAPQVAQDCLRIGASLGDMVAAYLYGRRLLEDDSQSDMDDEGMAWLSLAAQAGIGQAYRHFMRLRTGGRAAPTAPPMRESVTSETLVSLLEGLSVDLSAPEIPEPRELNQEPRIAIADGLLTRELTDYLIIRAEPQLMDSETIHPDTGERIRNTLRTSRSMNFDPGSLDVLLGIILDRIASVAGLPLAQAEPLAVLHYSPGQQYHPHFDYFTADAMQAQGELARGGQRVATVLTYLNDVEAGGETEFPELDIKVEARRGTSFMFSNCDASGEPDPRSLHAGCPVAAGEKWVSTLWFRERAIEGGRC